MITIHTSILSENIQVKSISAAWNKIREIRDNTDVKVLEGTILKVTGDEGQDMSRIPEQIIFLTNKNGKIEFKDYAKVQARNEAKKATVEKIETVA